MLLDAIQWTSMQNTAMVQKHSTARSAGHSTDVRPSSVYTAVPCNIWAGRAVGAALHIMLALWMHHIMY
jgi:hypothetical protein